MSTYVLPSDFILSIAFEMIWLLGECLSVGISYFMGSASRVAEALFWGIALLDILTIARSFHSLMRGGFVPAQDLRRIDSRFAVYYMVVLFGFLFGVVRG
jgi:hypothetical protein